MKTVTTPETLQLTPEDNRRLAGLCGQNNTHLKQIEARFDVKISHRGHLFLIDGEADNVGNARNVLKALYDDTRDDVVLSNENVHMRISQLPNDDQAGGGDPSEVVVRLRKLQVRGKNRNQRDYLRNITGHDINFSVGPAGTGKTYLAVACAVEALANNEVDRIILVRPAVEAGERLGFLPGDIGQKVEPYLRPLYDALYEMLGFDRVGKLLDRGVIELAPLAYMRGRTLNESFIILDEAQNSTVEQMEMFLTRIGYGSKAVIAGDITQVDLPKGTVSGLRYAAEALIDIEGISVTRFVSRDVVRHPLVQRIVEVFEARALTNRDDRQ